MHACRPVYKTTLVVKPEFIEEATEMFDEGSGIKITTEGQKILGAVLGMTAFVKEYVAKKVNDGLKRF